MLKDIFAGLLIGLVALTGLTAQTQYVRGPKGGCYEVTKDGKKAVKRALCDSASVPQAKSTDVTPMPGSHPQTQPNTKEALTSPSVTQASTAANRSPQKTKDGKTYITGSKGGCYYVTASGKKQYVDHSMCQ